MGAFGFKSVPGCVVFLAGVVFEAGLASEPLCLERELLAVEGSLTVLVFVDEVFGNLELGPSVCK